MKGSTEQDRHQVRNPKKKKRAQDFEAGERAWFESYEPSEYEDDGSHELNGTPRLLAELLQDQPGRSWLVWGSVVGAFGLLGLWVLTLAEWLMR